MTSHSSGRNPRRPRGGSRRRGDASLASPERAPSAPAKKSFWQKITAALFTGTAETGTKPVRHRSNGRAPSNRFAAAANAPARKPESVEVTTPRLYVGNLSFDATESDLFELFNGVGAGAERRGRDLQAQSAFEGFCLRPNADGRRSETRREELHDKEFLGRKLVVSGAKSSEHHRRN